MKPATKNLYQQRMISVLLHIQSHLDEDLSLESLAEISFFSPVHFHRIFKGMMGETVVEHIRRIRLERAAMQLVCGQSNVTEASFDAGYETVESFSRAFKKMFGCPPSKYRDQHWEALHAKLPGTIHYMPEDARTGMKITQIGGTTVEVRIENVSPKDVIFVRHTGPYEQCDTAWKTLCDWACPKGLCRIDSQFIGVCYDDPQVTPPEKIRYDACIAVKEKPEVEGEIGFQTLGGGEYAIVTHKGPYNTVEKSYAQIMGQWLPQSGKQLRNYDPSYEVYLNDPDNTPPEELLTDLYIPLK